MKEGSKATGVHCGHGGARCVRLWRQFEELGFALKWVVIYLYAGFYMSIYLICRTLSRRVIGCNLHF